MQQRSASVLLPLTIGAVLLFALSSQSFVQPPAGESQGNLRAVAATAGGLAVPASLAAAPAFAGEPPSVGEHWYWDLGFGSLHGETASIIFLVFFLLVVLSVLGFGGSSKKSTA
eukprot:TRINITY_DN3021_c0_g2_i1.p2 TRINITY_DN3021_c0_g2~~TRINITY_DN3021_c0_g2_i1.p2  ORF type:complete len:114 (+),score=32.61 TRINITY_DN3021_c0_g2_i1:86-427(+)